MLQRICQGDEAALQELLDQQWEPLVRHLTSMCGYQDAAKDAAQEAFVRLWSRRGEWNPTGTAQGLLYRIARNLVLDSQKGKRVREAYASDEGNAPTSIPTPLDEAVAGSLQQDFEQALATLPPRRREVFRLSRFGGLSHNEIATAMDMSRRTVANHMSLALNDLRTLLHHHISGSPEAPSDSREAHDG